MTLQDLQPVASLLQSIFVSIAVVIGGFWTLFTFRTLRQIARARAELQKTNLELEKITVEREKLAIETEKIRAELQRIELDLKRQAVIEMTIDASQTSLSNDPSKFVSVVVDISNKGSRNTRLSFGNANPFLVTPVSFQPDGHLGFGRSTSFPVVRAPEPGGVPAPSLVVRAGGREQVPFFFRIESPGLYFLTFAATLSSEEHEIAREEGVSYPTSWVAKKYLVVE